MMTSLNTYLDLCTSVYDLSKPTAPKEAYAFYRSYALEANGLILEPFCGSGRFLLPFAAEGFDVQGFDGSQHMLNALQAKAKLQNLQVKVWQGLVGDLTVQENYKLIFIPKKQCQRSLMFGKVLCMLAKMASSFWLIFLIYHYKIMSVVQFVGMS
jgi:SAM-dependent methyltransferase